MPDAFSTKSAPDGVVLGLDWDSEAIERVRERLKYGGRLIWRNQTLPIYAGPGRARHREAGIVVDLGVSSFQIEEPQRGFSFIKLKAR